jgi:CheY-like chemotaxis protein
MSLGSDLSSSTVVDGAVVNATIDNLDREANEALREGVQAAQSGDRTRARTALLRATELDPSSESAWLWLASISEYPEELVIFLNNVLDINPYNGRALEWMAATKSLLAKTFVQRGVDAANGGQADLAAQCFNQALENDQANADAWLWLAKLANSPEGKLTYLEKVVEIDPSNEEAGAEYAAAKNSINQALLAEARSAAVAGRKGDANDLLDAFIAENPESEEGWILRSHLADGFADKIAAFERVLEINPSNTVALSGIESLRSIMALVPPAEEAQSTVVPDAMENTAFVIDSERHNEALEVHDKSPTQDLEFPAAAVEFHEQQTGSPFTPAEDIAEPAIEEVAEETVVFQPEEIASSETSDSETVIDGSESNESGQIPDWGMNTVAFSFAFPGGDLSAEESASNHADEAASISTEESFEFTAASSVENNEGDDALYETAAYDPVPSPASLAEEFAAVPFPTEQISFVPETIEVNLPESFIPAEPIVDAIESSDVPLEAEPVEAFQPSFTEVATEHAIPMPADFSVTETYSKTGFETTLVRLEPAAVSEMAACPFCKAENPVQAFTCGGCLSTLTLSDLEMLLANSHADKVALRDAVKEMLAVRDSRPLDEKELTNVGIAYLNLRDFDAGFQYLQEASQLNPNNVVLGSQVNSLLIRLDEIRQQEEAAQSMPREKRILVVDDSATVRKLIAGKLEKCGHEVFCAADGIEAIEQLDNVVPDLILLDITMPRMDGYQVCKVIRGKESTKNVPVVMISGKDGFFDKVRGRMAGTTGYITKPFGPETLMKAVETYLSSNAVEV